MKNKQCKLPYGTEKIPKGAKYYELVENYDTDDCLCDTYIYFYDKNGKRIYEDAVYLDLMNDEEDY